MKCRLLYLIGQLGPGGLERQLYYLLQSMDRERYRPEVVVWSFREDDTYMSHIRKLGVPLHSFPSTLSRRHKVLAFRGMIVRMQPEVIHSYSFHTNVAAWWAARGTNSIAIGSLRSDFVYDRKVSGFLLSRLSSRWPSMQIYNNQTAAERDRAVGGLFVPRQIFVVRNGVDLHLFRKVPLSMNGRVHISGVGTLLHVKRWDRLLRAASNLKKRGLDFQVEICGAGPLRERLEQEAETLGVMDRVAFIDHTDDVIEVLARSPLALAVSVGSTATPLSIVPGTRSRRARNVQPLAPGGGLAQVYPVNSV